MTTATLDTRDDVASIPVQHAAHPRRVVALIPAHDEEDGIVATIRSLQAQKVPVDRIIVMADNCTDRTAEFARAAGAEVVETVDNTGKKAGALNQGLRMVLPTLNDSDYIICQDADGALTPDFLTNAFKVYDSEEGPSIGGLSGAIKAREHHTFVEAAQAIEYARGARLMSRNWGRVHVLSGAAALFPAHVLLRVAASRGTLLPGDRGTFYLEDSLTEDYELTIAIKKLGYICRSTKYCEVVTDVMPTYKMLRIQRLRWYRGAMESVSLYGWSKLTHKTWFGIGFTFFSSVLFPLAVSVLFAGYLIWGSKPDLRYTVLFPLFALESIVTARRVKGWRSYVLAVFFVPLWFYDNLMFAYYWRALLQALRKQKRIWVT